MTIKIYRGQSATMPVLYDGQPGYAEDTQEFWIGTPQGNVNISNGARFKTLEDEFNALLSPSTLDSLKNQNLTLNTYNLGYVDSKLEPINASLVDNANDLLWRGINIKLPFGTSLSPAKGDGITDDTQAFKDFASQFPYTPLIIPDGDYIINDTINFNCNMIQGLGNARLIFDNPLGKDGLSFDPTYANKVVGVKGVQIACRTSNGGSAIKTPLDSTEYTQNMTKFEFEYLTIGGYTTPTTPLSYESVESWAACLDIGDAYGVGIREVYGRGNYRIDQDVTSQFQSTFIKLHANNTEMTAHIDGFACNSFYRAFDLGDKIFFHILHGDIIQSYDGIYESGVTIYNESRIKAININAQRYGAYLKTGSNRQLDGITVRRHKSGIKTSTDAWYGIYYSGGSGVMMTNCHAQPDLSSGNFSGTHTAFYLDACNTGVFNGLIIGAGIEVGLGLNNITGDCIDNVVTWQNRATDKVYNLTNNARSSVFGKLTKVSTFTGTVFVKDGTIGTTNTQTSTTTV